MEFARDLAIIILCVETFIAIGVLIVIGLKVLQLFNTVNNEIPKLVSSAKRTMGTVQGTTAFISKNAVMPVIKIVAAAAAANKFAQVMLGHNKPTKGGR